MTEEEDDHLENRASGSTSASVAVAQIVEDPPGLGAWLAQVQSQTGHSCLEWQDSCGSRREFQLVEAVPSKKIYNATVEEEVRDLKSDPFSIHTLRTSADFIDRRNFDSFIPHDVFLDASLQEAHADPRRSVFPGSSLCAELGVLPVGVHAVSHFYVVGSITGRRANEFSVLLPQDAITTSNGWSPTPIPEKLNVVITHPTPILDLKVRATPAGNIFAMRTSSMFTLLAFARADDIRGSGDIQNFRWEKPLHLGIECFAGNAVADFALNPFLIHERSHIAILVDSTGGLWRTRVGAEEVAELPFASPYAAVEQLRLGCPTDGRNAFARITYGRDEDTAIVARQDAIRVFNLEDHRLDSTLFTMKDSKCRILDMAQPSRSFPGGNHRVICTSEEVIWLDLDKPAVPALRLKHYRDNDETLALHCAFRDGVCHTFLWSRRTPAMTVYTTPPLGPLQLLLPAYDIPPPAPNIRRSGLTSIHVPSRQMKRSQAPEALVVIESAADGTVYQREFTTGRVPHFARELEHGRIQHKRLNADQALSHLPLEDPKGFKLAHLFMLYNKLYSNSPSLHLTPTGPDSLERCLDDDEDRLLKLPLEILAPEQSLEEAKATVLAESSLFTSFQAIDGSATPSSALKHELDRLALQVEDSISHRLNEEMLGIPGMDPGSPPSTSKTLQDLYNCDRFGRSIQYGRHDGVERSAVGEAHRFACDQIAVDLRLSRDVLSAEVPTAPAVGVQDVAMSAYDRLADLPDVEYGFFKPVKADGSIPTSDGARALLSEWTLGADPNIRPPFTNPYSQQVRDEKVANKQLKAFKTRIAQGVGVSASQPVSAFTRQPVRPLPTQMALATPEPYHLRRELEQTPQPQRERPSAVQSQTFAATQQETPMPMTQMMPGAHGGRPAKKKKRTGGF